MVLGGRMIPCQSREAVVTVLSYRNGIMDGYLLSFGGLFGAVFITLFDGTFGLR